MNLKIDRDPDVEWNVVLADVEDQLHLILQRILVAIGHREALARQVRRQEMSVSVSGENYDRNAVRRRAGLRNKDVAIWMSFHAQNTPLTVPLLVLFDG